MPNNYLLAPKVSNNTPISFSLYIHTLLLLKLQRRRPHALCPCRAARRAHARTTHADLLARAPPPCPSHRVIPATQSLTHLAVPAPPTTVRCAFVRPSRLPPEPRDHADPPFPRPHPDTRSPLLQPSFAPAVARRRAPPLIVVGTTGGFRSTRRPPTSSSWGAPLTPPSARSTYR